MIIAVGCKLRRSQSSLFRSKYNPFLAEIYLIEDGKSLESVKTKSRDFNYACINFCVNFLASSLKNF